MLIKNVTHKQHYCMWAVLFLLICIGSVLRLYGALLGPYVLFFSLDDFNHFRLSGYKPPDMIADDLKAVFLQSYRDPHPPMRNIIVNLIFRFSDSIYASRLVGLVPSVLIIPAMCAFGYTISSFASSRQRWLVGLCFAFFATFMHLMIRLSIETRPYMLMLLFQLVAMTCLIHYARSYALKWLFGFLLCSVIVIFTDYSAVPLIGLCTVIMLYVSSSKTCPKLIKTLVLMSAVFLLFVVFFQYWNMHKFGTFDEFTGESWNYIRRRYIVRASGIPWRFLNFFKIFLQDTSPWNGARNIIPLLLILYLWGLWCLYRRQSYLMLILASVPFIVAILLAYMRLFPFSPQRQSLYLVPCVLIGWSAALESNIWNRSRPFTCVILLMAGIAFLASQNLMKAPKAYYRGFANNKRMGMPYLNEQGFVKLAEVLEQYRNSETLILLEQDIDVKYSASYVSKLSRLKNAMVCKYEKECTRPPVFRIRPLDRNNRCIVKRGTRIDECLAWQKKRDSITNIVGISYNNRRRRLLKVSSKLGFRKMVKQSNYGSWLVLHLQK